MGQKSSSSSGPDIKKIKPQLVQQVIPLQSYRQAAAYVREMRRQTNAALTARYQEVGTPAEMGARSRGIQAQEAASYLASLPTGDRYSRAAAGTPELLYSAAREQAQERSTDAREAYATALNVASRRAEDNPSGSPGPLLDTDYRPSWSQRTIPAGMPRRGNNREDEGNRDSLARDNALRDYYQSELNRARNEFASGGGSGMERNAALNRVLTLRRLVNSYDNPRRELTSNGGRDNETPINA